jgi:hypothetical protein
LFTREELAAAFALLMPPGEADTLSRKWFDEFAEATDNTGRYVYPSAWGERKPIEPRARVAHLPEWDTAKTIARHEALFAQREPDELEQMFMRLSDLHLALVALVSDELFERMRQVRFLTNVSVARNRLQLLRAVRAYRRRVGLPPVV